MKVVILGGDGDRWDELRAVVTQLGPDDEVVATGACASRVEYLLKAYRRDHRQRPPQLQVERLDVPRYDRAKAITLLAAALVTHHMPGAVVLVGEPEPELQEEVMRFAAAHLPRPVPVWTAGEFVRERSSV
jgi:hypothetical protein